MYLPQDAVNLKSIEFPQIRLGLQGEPGTCKTRTALTFPNPVVFDADNGLTAYAGKDITKIPIHSDAWCEAYTNRYGLPLRTATQHPINRKLITQHWIQYEAPKLEEDQTLVLDSWSKIQDYFDKQTALEPSYTKSGEIDDYAFWDEKIIWSRDICSVFETLRCHVVVTFHEARERNKKTGEILSKMQPAMQGKFVTQLQRYFTDYFRCVVFDRLDANKQPIIEDLPNGNKRKAVDYYWQTQSDGEFNAKCRLINTPTWIKSPSFELFKGYVGVKQ